MNEYMRRICKRCSLNGKCDRCPSWHEDTEEFDCSMYKRADKEQKDE